jgi:purine-nucleoside phosphorylase
MSLHLDAQNGDIAPIVLLPGDPKRAEWIAEEFLEDPVCHNQRRGALGFTGTWGGKRVSVQSTGMGVPSASIYLHELMTEYGAQVLIRIGTCGAIQPHLKVGDLILAMSASTDSGINRHWFGGKDFAPTADFQLLRTAYDLAPDAQTGNILTCDLFYDRPGVYDAWREHGVLAAEMETAALYTLAARHGTRALTILTVSDIIATGEHLPPDDRANTLRRMTELALKTGTSQA